MFFDQGHDSAEARVGAVTIFVVDRVDHRTTADEFKACLQDGWLGRVDDERQRGCAAKARHNLLHIGHTVAPDVIHAHVKQMRAVARLLARDVNAIVPALLEHRVAKRLRPVGVGALTNREKRVVLVETHVLVETRDAGVVLECAGSRSGAAKSVDHGLQVLRRCAAASTNQLQTEFSDKLFVCGREFGGRERVARPVGSEHRQTRVGHAHNGNPTQTRELPQVLTHLGRAGCAVEPDCIDAQRFERRECGRNFAAHQHGAGQLDGDFDKQRQTDAQLHARSLAPVDRGFGLQQVL